MQIVKFDNADNSVIETICLCVRSFLLPIPSYK